MYHHKSSIVIIIITIVYFQNQNTLAQDIPQDLKDIIMKKEEITTKIVTVFPTPKKHYKIENNNYIFNPNKDIKHEDNKNDFKHSESRRQLNHNNVYHSYVKPLENLDSKIKKRKNNPENDKPVEMTSKDYDFVAQQMKNNDNYIEPLNIDKTETVEDENYENREPKVEYDTYHFDFHNIIESQMTESAVKSDVTDYIFDITSITSKTTKTPENIIFFNTDNKKVVMNPKLRNYFNNNKILSPKFLKMQEINKTMQFTVIGKDEVMEIPNHKKVVINHKNIINKDAIESSPHMYKLNGFLKQLHLANVKRQSDQIKGPSYAFEEDRNKYIKMRPVKDIRTAFELANGLFEVANNGIQSLKTDKQINIDRPIYIDR